MPPVLQKLPGALKSLKHRILAGSLHSRARGTGRPVSWLGAVRVPGLIGLIKPLWKPSRVKRCIGDDRKHSGAVAGIPAITS